MNGRKKIVVLKIRVKSFFKGRRNTLHDQKCLRSHKPNNSFTLLKKNQKKSENNTYSLLLYIYICFKPKPKISKQIAPSKIMGKIKDITILIKLRSTFSNIFPAMFFGDWSLALCSFHRKRAHFRIEKNQAAKT